jgi:hypothetical protein
MIERSTEWTEFKLNVFNHLRSLGQSISMGVVGENLE